MLGKEFKELVNAEIEDGDVVVLSKDSEGNSFSPFSDLSTGRFSTEPGSPWYGEVHLREITPELRKNGYTEEDIGPEEAKPCICLWPTN